MNEWKSRVLSATAFVRNKEYINVIDQMATAEENQRLKPFNELLGDALQVIQDATNSPPEAPDWAAFETILTRANALLTKGEK